MNCYIKHQDSEFLMIADCRLPIAARSQQSITAISCMQPKAESQPYFISTINHVLLSSSNSQTVSVFEVWMDGEPLEYH